MSNMLSSVTSGSCKNSFLLDSDNINIGRACSAHTKGFPLFIFLFNLSGEGMLLINKFILSCTLLRMCIYIFLY